MSHGCTLEGHATNMRRMVVATLLDQPWRLRHEFACQCGALRRVTTRPAEMREVYEFEMQRRGLRR